VRSLSLSGSVSVSVSVSADPSACCQRGQELLHAGESDTSSLGRSDFSCDASFDTTVLFFSYCTSVRAVLTPSFDTTAVLKRLFVLC